MNSILLKTVLASSLLVLAACGGSGSSSPASRSNPNNTPTGKVALGGLVIHGTLSSWGTNSVRPGSDLQKEDIQRHDEINTLVFKGKRIDLVPLHAGGNIYRRVNDSTELYVGNNLRYARYGSYLHSESPKDAGFRNWDAAWFYQGQATPETVVAAQKGTARYTGVSLSTQSNTSALNTDPFSRKQYLNNIEGTTTIDIDFNNKTFSAQIKPGDSRFTDLPAVYGVIKENGLVSAGTNHGFIGQFYGPKAEEAAGMYSFTDLEQKGGNRFFDKTNVLGTFGVKKQ